MALAEARTAGIEEILLQEAGEGVIGPICSTANTRDLFLFCSNCLRLKKLLLMASDYGSEAIESSGTPVGFDSDSCHAYNSSWEGPMKERLIFFTTINLTSIKV